MQNARQALEAALRASADRLNQRPIINIVVEPAKDHYTVHLSLLAAVSQAESECLQVKVDAETGAAAPPASTPCPNPMLSLQEDWRNSPFIDGLRAYQAGLQAIKGYEHYDPYGRLAIQLKNDHYEVTFPDPAARLQGGHTADYTYQVWLNARTGAVIKILAAS
ncbi:hypothetical protein [Piscinibacter sakaiensis]|uniref:hypothetical protein n=1 Tax=Piscinibacter sakaiensis TaxID=1547922 RepID=UPI003AAC6A7F